MGAAALILEIYEEDGRVICGIYQMAAKIDLPPKQWLHLVRSGMAFVEQKARESGATEMRVAGRDWSRVLPDYEPFDGVKNGLRKVLR
jgi:hypothetical protein